MNFLSFFSFRIIVFLLIVFFSNISPDDLIAQNWSKILKDIDNPKMQNKIWKAADKTITENPNSILGNYIRAYLQKKSPDQLFLAWIHIDRAFQTINNQDAHAELFIAKEALGDPLLVITKERKIIDDELFKKISEGDNLKELTFLLPYLTTSGHLNEYIKIRNRHEFLISKAEHTQEAYNRFINLFTDAEEIDSAIILKEKLDFEKVRVVDHIYEYNEFLRKHPLSVFEDTVIFLRDSKAFKLLASSISAEDFSLFLRKYPSSVFTQSVQKMREDFAFQKAKEANTYQAFQAFVMVYPDSEFIGEAIGLRDQIALNELRAVKDETGILRFLVGVPLVDKAFENFLQHYYLMNQMLLESNLSGKPTGK